MSHPIQDMKAGYNIGDFMNMNRGRHDVIIVSNYAKIGEVIMWHFFESQVRIPDENDTAVFHIKWKNQK